MPPPSPWPLRALLGCLLAIALPAGATPEIVSISPAEPVLQPQTQVVIVVRASSEAQYLKGFVEPGQLSAPELLSADEVKFTYRAGSFHYPHWALLAFWTEREGVAPRVTTLRLPLTGQMDLTLKTDPGAEVSVEVRGKTFGPQKADASGRTQIPIEVPPGVQSVQVRGETQNLKASRTLALKTPQEKPVAALLLPTPPRAGQPSWLLLLGLPTDDLSSSEVSVQRGHAKLVKSAPGHALYEIRTARQTPSLRIAVVPPPAHKPARLELSASVSAAPLPPVISAPILESTVAPPFPRRVFFPGVWASGFYGGGSNAGAGAGLELAYHLPGADNPVALVTELGLRAASISIPRFQTTTLTLHSSLYAFSLDVGPRIRLWRNNFWGLHGRVGIGLLPLLAQVRLAGRSHTESGLGAEGLAGVQLSHAFPALEGFLEIRASYTPITSRTLDAQLPWLSLLVGIRRF